MRFQGGASTGMNPETLLSFFRPSEIRVRAAAAGSVPGYSVFFSPAAARLR